MKQTLLALLVATLCLTALLPSAYASSTGGMGLDREAQLYRDTIYANVSVPTVLDNSSEIVLAVEFTSVNLSTDLTCIVYVNITTNATDSANTGAVLVTIGNSTTANVTFTAGTLTVNATANVTVTLVVEGSDVDVWYGVANVNYGNDYSMSYMVALLMTVLPVLMTIIAIVLVVKIVMGLPTK